MYANKQAPGPVPFGNRLMNQFSFKQVEKFECLDANKL